MQEVIEFSAHQMSVDHSSSFLVAGVLAFIEKIWKKRISDWEKSHKHPFFSHVRTRVNDVTLKLS